ncbi:hypothetical protein ACFX5U_08640 [Sphingobacterium sp. SG20118]|uniref:hypothetical protein n=1 Tax=Sphingobacterium sp. SG20118 TaxID=3367156 RepID=UPI0037DFC42A
MKFTPVYELDRLLDHHYKFYILNLKNENDKFIKHMMYVIVPYLRKVNDGEIRIDLLEKWIEMKIPSVQVPRENSIVNNTIQMGNINAPIQFQQNSNNSVQTQHNQYQLDDIKTFFDLLSKDIQNLDKKIREEFCLEINYASTQLVKDKDIQPQLINIGSLMKEIGLGVFSNLIASPVFEYIRPSLGL